MELRLKRGKTPTCHLYVYNPSGATMKYLALSSICASLLIAGCENKPPAFGQDAPMALVESVKEPGKTFQLGGPGKVRVIDFFATWCGPCEEATPIIGSIAEKVKNEPVDFIGISDEERDTVEAHFKHDPAPYPLYLDKHGDAFRHYLVQEIPTIFVIGKTGKVLFSGSPFQKEEVADAIQRGLKG